LNESSKGPFFTQKKSARELKFPERFLQFEVFIFV
jgi:hypothetical protein